jgi:hypothetical protein
MKLSDAIVLGSLMKRGEPSLFFDSRAGCGCALGGAFLAVGVEQEEMLAHLPQKWRDQEIKTYWPWLTSEIVDQIGELYWRGFFQGDNYPHTPNGVDSLSLVVEFVKSVEPPEELSESSQEQLTKDRVLLSAV